jgi:hypothetical protein
MKLKYKINIFIDKVMVVPSSQTSKRLEKKEMGKGG